MWCFSWWVSYWLSEFLTFRILQIQLKFHLRSIRLALEKKVHDPECFRITGRVHITISCFQRHVHTLLVVSYKLSLNEIKQTLLISSVLWRFSLCFHSQLCKLRSIYICYFQIIFDDTNKDGQMVVNLFSSLDEFKCTGRLASLCKNFSFYTKMINHNINSLKQPIYILYYKNTLGQVLALYYDGLLQ